MPKTVALHTLLPVRATLLKAASVIFGETEAMLRKPDVFTDVTVMYSMTETPEGMTPEVQAAMEASKSSRKKLVTTVQSRLNYDMAEAVKLWDLHYQIAEGNTRARANVELADGTVVLENMPATFLMSLETWLENLRNRVKEAPVVRSSLDTKESMLDGNKVYSVEQTAVVNRENVAWVSVAKPTAQHPEQVKEQKTVVPVGITKTVTSYGMLTSSELADYLGRIDELLIAVKKAVSQANTVAVECATPCEALSKYIFQGQK